MIGLILTVLALAGFLFNLYIVLALVLTKQVNIENIVNIVRALVLTKQVNIENIVNIVNIVQALVLTKQVNIENIGNYARSRLDQAGETQHLSRDKGNQVFIYVYQYYLGAVHLLHKTVRGRGGRHFLIFSDMGEGGVKSNLTFLCLLQG